eukprot:223863_1
MSARPQQNNHINNRFRVKQEFPFAALPPIINFGHYQYNFNSNFNHIPQLNVHQSNSNFNQIQPLNIHQSNSIKIHKTETINELNTNYNCDKCDAAFFYKNDVINHKKYSECTERPYLCPFCERPFKSLLSVKKHCYNLHSHILNWDIIGELLKFIEKTEKTHKHNKKNLNYAKMVRKFARDYFLIREQKNGKKKK